MKKTLLFCFFWFSCLEAFGQKNSDLVFQELVARFIPEYKTLGISELALSYVENLENIQSLLGIAKQQAFFQKYRLELESIDRNTLSFDKKYEYDTLTYQVDLDIERLALEKQLKSEGAPIPTNGMSHLTHSKEWYSYFLKKWVSTRQSPEELMAFGKREVARVRTEMSRIQKLLGYEGKDEQFANYLNDSSFTITNEKVLYNGFINFRNLMLTNLARLFDTVVIPTVQVKPIPNPTKDSPPGYYKEGIFYYNFYNKRFAARSLEWLFIHEALPGHHYQGSVGTKHSAFKDLFGYAGFSEGWGAYAEDLGKDLGAYKDLHQYYGKWEWDLVRSARVVLDTGLNYFGWTREEAMDYWNKYVPNQSEIAEREVNRVLNWPLQVIAYKVGERTFLDLRERYLAISSFNLKQYHALVLDRGAIPLPVLEEVVEDARHE